MRDTPHELPREEPEPGAPSRRPEDRPDDVGDRARAREWDDDRRPGADHGADRGPRDASPMPDMAERDLQERWGKALTLDDPGDRNLALADLAGRDDIDPDHRRRVANSIIGDDDLRTYGLSVLAREASDPHAARRCADDIPIEPERDRALARIARRPDIDTDQARRVAGDIRNDDDRDDVLADPADRCGDRRLAYRIADDITADPERGLCSPGSTPLPIRR